ncbi:uncharacterized protein LOC120940663 isoform X2 [Rana temporaria]|uniref:uncharacterized protein LOC120940663 isoform X2 n=1 Tax=Rana temporaria TaxID=8407 RepID=UPI001AAD1382|nr:uncharacterized protein LOC120940663 isoform X2 [Rana temporaria]
MAPARSSIGYPWILDAITKYKGEAFMLKPAPAQVVEFLKMPERTEECQYPGAVVHISDRQYYIRAIITREAQETLEREDEHFTLAHIKNKIVILKKFTLSFAAEEDLRCCEFYLTIEHFCILAMEINTVDLLNCNVETGVMKKIKELWQMYMTELQTKETMSDMNSSDMSLTQLLMIVSEERLGELKSAAEQCLHLDSFATQEIAPQARTIWSTEMRNNQSNDNSFSIPIHLLLIPPEEEAALEQMSGFRPDVNPGRDADNSEELNSEGSDSSQQYNSAVSTLSQEPMEDACNGQTVNPWNNLPSLYASESISSPHQYNSAVSTLSQEPMDDACNGQPVNPWNNLPSLCDSDSISFPASDPSVVQQNSEKDPATDSDTTPDILHYHQDKSIHRSSESQDEIPTLNLSKLLSEQAEPEAKTSSSSNQKGAPQSDSALPSSQRRLSDCSQSLLGLMPLVQDSSSLIHTSPQRKVALERKLPISPISSHGSESKRDSNIIRTILPETSKRDNETCHSPREWRAVKRKQAPEDLDTILSAPAQQASVHREIPDCAAAVISSVPTTNNGAQTETNSDVEERSKTINGSRMDKKQTRTEQIHYDSKSFQYKYKNPSTDLCTCVKAVRIPADLHEWAVKILSEARETDP